MINKPIIIKNYKNVEFKPTKLFIIFTHNINIIYKLLLSKSK